MTAQKRDVSENCPLDIFHRKVAPIKLTESRKCRLNTMGWGILSDYLLESVKIYHQKPGVLMSVATLRITDQSGEITCVIKGSSTGLLFGVTPKQWKEVENLCLPGEQLFYRYFKNGINRSFRYEQQLFYNFCMTNQKHEVFLAKFQRCVNVRNKFKNEALLNIIELKRSVHNLIDQYTEHLREQAEDLSPDKGFN